MARYKLRHASLMADLEKVPKRIKSQVKIEEFAQVQKPYHHMDCILGELSRSTSHGAYHILEEP